jgi:acid phosphatase (class A)
VKSTIILTLVTALAASAACAQGTKTLKYLTPAEIDPSRLLPAPDADGSGPQQREMTELWRILKTRTPERFKQAQWDNANESPIVFASAIGPAFDLKALPETAKLLDAVQNDQSVAATGAKDYFKRKFAAVIDISIVPLTCDPADVRASASKPGGRALRSYPSGHATMGFSIGAFLAALIPEKSQAILARAAEYGFSREVCGDHYHSDVEASHALGNAVAIMLLKNAALQPQIEAARAELRAANIISKGTIAKGTIP